MKYLFSRSLVFSLVFLFSCTLMHSSSRDVLLAPLGEGEKRSVHEDWGEDFMVVTQGPYSTMAGEQIFQRGGNIIDVATAVTFTISVERPQSTGIGGGGFALMRMFDKEGEENFYAVDFREKAPLKGHRDMFLNEKGEAVPERSRRGPLSVGVPGMVAGILELHEKYGQLPLRTVMAPAISLARNGLPVYPELAHALERSSESLAKYPATKRIFFRDNRPLELGEILTQRDLAETLALIASQGRSAFYEGEIADKIIASTKAHGGILERADFKAYDVLWRTPVVGTYRGHKVLSMPPPSSGGAHIIQILNILEGDPLSRYGVHDPRTVHLVSSAMQQAFADRATHMGDADFVDIPLEHLISKEYAREIREKIPNKRARTVDEVHAFELDGDYEEPDQTTHFTIADGKGNIFSSTQTINGYFGSGMVAEGTGIVLNNEMDDFAAKAGAVNIFGAIGGNLNLVEPEKRPLSSMSPTIVLKDGDPFMALGSPSGTRILTCVAHTIMNVIDHNLDLYDAVAAVRYHHQWRPDFIRVDRPGLSEKATNKLESWGHEVKVQDMGCRVQALMFTEQGKIHGVSDIRGQGMSRGQ